MDAKLPAELRPVWEIVSQECSTNCLATLEPHLGLFVRVADLAGQQGLTKLRAFLRCIGQLHDRAEHAEKAAEHWQNQWEEKYREALELQRGKSNASLGYEVQISDLQQALSLQRRACEQQLLEQRRLQEAFQASADLQIWHRHGQQQQLRQLWGTTSAQLGRCGELERRLALERAESQRLQQRLTEAELGARTAEVERQDAAARAKDAEHYALEARKYIPEKVDEALEVQKAQLMEEMQTERKGWQKELANAIPLQLAREVLGAYAELWRSGCAASPGLHSQRAERALRRLFDLDVFAAVMPPRDELLQEPLRRAMGDAAAKDVGEALVAELRRSHAHVPKEPEASRLEGWSQHGGSLQHLRDLPLRAKAMILASENR
ncbi:unnamed protein product [Effrenium voratum]|nr:unnamed protein product [Effrenium voratum]